MTSIRYWDTRSSNPSPSASPDATSSRAIENAQLFEASMLDNLLSPGASTGSLFSNNSISSLFSNDVGIEQRVKQAKELGMEKVLAAQLSSPLPAFGNQTDQKQSNYHGLSGLDNMITLTIQKQLLEAQKAIEAKTLRTEELTRSEGQGIEETHSLVDAIKRIQDNIQEIASDHEVSFDFIKNQL